MRSAGIDISKSAYAALALAVDGEPKKAFVWIERDKKTSEPDRLDSFFDFCVHKLVVCRPDVVVVEMVMGLPSKRVVQILSRFEGVALLAAKRHGKRHGGCVVINIPVSQSRAAALGIAGNAKKELAWQAIKKMYPDFQFGNANQGGMDKGDAMTHALAGPLILERR